MPVDSSIPVLIVDDYQTAVRIVRGHLAQLGLHNVDEASGGAQALPGSMDSSSARVTTPS